MAKFTKKPVTIDAVQWTGHSVPFDFAKVEVYGYSRSKASPLDLVTCNYCGNEIHMKMGNTHYHSHGWVDTAEGGHIVCPGDWIIRGVKGEFYPCKPDIFAATYEDAALSQPVAEADSVLDGSFYLVTDPNAPDSEVIPLEWGITIGAGENARTLFHLPPGVTIPNSVVEILYAMREASTQCAGFADRIALALSTPATTPRGTGEGA